MCTELSKHEINQLIIGELYQGLYGEKPDPKLLESQSEEQQARSLAHGANQLEKRLTALESKPKGDIGGDIS